MSYRRLNLIEKLIKRAFNRQHLIPESSMENKIIGYSKPNLSYFMLLAASVVIATLGLLMNASAIVIGSMIISPLTWPLFGLADGVALGRQKRIWTNLVMVVSSLAIGLTLAYVMTYLSPLKVINAEILARSKPTLLDAIVALTAGGIGAMAIIRRNISDSVAGVAIALSLTPPLCVLGIGLSLGEYTIAWGSFLLLVTNGLSITFIASLLFVMVHYSWRRQLRMAPRALLVMLVGLLITAIPLYRLLNVYSLQNNSYSTVLEELNNFSADLGVNDGIHNLQTSLERINDQDTVVVEADFYLGSGINFSLERRQQLIKALEDKLGKDVDLRLRIQQTTELSSRSDISDKQTIEDITTSTIDSIASFDQSIVVETVSVSKLDENSWKALANVSGLASAVPSDDDVKNIEADIAELYNINLQLNLNYNQRVQLKSSQDADYEQLQNDIKIYLDENYAGQAYLEDFKLEFNEETPVVKIELMLGQDTEISEDFKPYVSGLLVEKYSQLPEIKILAFRYQSL